MIPHLRYLWYLVRHKYFVFRACMIIGVPVHQAILHDWSKFRLSEWCPYVDHFYRNGYAGQHREGYYHNPDEAADEFNKAWLMHANRNAHHWQHWVLTYDSGDTIAIRMPERYVQEMVADWSGAGRAQNGRYDVRPWYEENKDRITLHPKTRDEVEQQISELSLRLALGDLR